MGEVNRFWGGRQELGRSRARVRNERQAREVEQSCRRGGPSLSCARLAGRIGSRAARRAVESSARRLRHTRRLFEAGVRSPVASRSQVLASQRRRKSVASVRQRRRVRQIVRRAGILAPVAGRDRRSSSAVEAPRKSRPANRRRVRGAVEIRRGNRAVKRLEPVSGSYPNPLRCGVCQTSRELKARNRSACTSRR